MKTDLEQKQTKSTERRLGPEKLWNELFSVFSVTSCEIIPKFAGARVVSTRNGSGFPIQFYPVLSAVKSFYP